MQSRIPIIIGVTGHIDIAPGYTQKLYDIALGFFNLLKKQYPSSPIKVLSSLAPGADTICARAALSAGLPLTAPLPMERELYAQDFTEAQKQEFSSLLEQADEVFVVPHKEEHRATKGFSYRQAGLYIATHAQLLLAMWDGEVKIVPEGGGTYETVEFMRRGYGKRSRKEKLSDGTGIVLQVVTPREGTPVPDCALRSYLYIDGRQEVDPTSSLRVKAFSHIELFNADLSRQNALVEKHGADVKKHIIDPCSEQKLHKNEREMLGVFVGADVLALHFQRRRVVTLRILSCLALLLVVSFLLYDEMESPFMLIAYGLFLLLAFMAYLISRTRRYHEKYMLYRVLAETLRVQFYMQLAGIGEYEFHVPAWRRTGELDFIDMSTLAFQHTGGKIEGAQNVLETYWIEGQADYHRQSMERKGRKYAFNQNAEKVLLIAAIAFFIIVSIFEYAFPSRIEAGLFDVSDQPFSNADFITLSNLFKIILGTIFAASAFLSNYYGKLSLNEQILDDGKMGKLFAAARSIAAQAEEGSGEMRDLLLELAIAETSENVNWYIFNRGNAPEFIID